MKIGGLLVTSLVLVGCSRAAESPPSHPSPPTTPASPPTLFGNLGVHHRAIKTENAPAQRYFDEGLTLLYGFNHEEALKSFQQAAVLDSASPMPYWGMALALGTNINDPAPMDRLRKAHQHLALSEARASNGSAVEQGLVAALAKRYVADSSGDQTAREQAYSEAMGALSAGFPDDQDVATLYAESMMNLHPWRLYQADGTPEPWTPAIVATLEGVLRQNPRHPGANHYYIHAVEASKTPERAAPAAEQLTTLVPGAGHLVHMPSHIYIRTGQFAKAAKSNAEAALVDEAYFRSVGPQMFYSMAYYAHNLHFESAAAMYGGNFAEALSAARRTVAVADPIADQMAMLEMFAAQEVIVLVRFGKWADVLASKAPVPTRTVQRGYYHWARGAALAGTGQIGAAAAELETLKIVLSKVPKEAMVGPINWGGDVLAVAIADLHGRLLEARGDKAGAIVAFTEAVAAEDRLGYNEPPDWLLPERERLGMALLSSGKAAEAEKVFRADLVKHVGNPRSLYGWWKSLDVRKAPGAGEARRQFEKAWAGADAVLGDGLYPQQ